MEQSKLQEWVQLLLRKHTNATKQASTAASLKDQAREEQVLLTHSMPKQNRNMTLLEALLATKITTRNLQLASTLHKRV